MKTPKMSVVGTARKVMVTKDETTIIEGAGTAASIKARIDQINRQIESATSEYEKENFEKRRAALSGKVAVIKVGGATETEIEEKKFRVDDAVAAVKAALDEGIVPGGGVTMINLSTELNKRHEEKVKKLAGQNQSQAAGVNLLIGALEQPFRILLSNSGLKPR